MRLADELTQLARDLPSFDFEDVASARTAFNALVPQPVDDVSVTVLEESATDGSGSQVAVRLYRTTLEASSPCLVYLHGGGFVLGGLDSEDSIARALALDVGCVVVSVDYRLAPEHPFPAALDDVATVLAWLRTAAVDLGIDPARVAIGGESAGACLAAASALRARDSGAPAPCFLYMGIPALDDRLETASMSRYANAPGWTRKNASWSWRHYLGRHVPDDSGHAAPARARTLAGLPPTFVALSECDPLRDEGWEFARRLLDDGVSTSVSLHAGTFHGSSLIAPAAQVSRWVHREKVRALQRGMQIHPSNTPPPPTARDTAVSLTGAEYR